MALVLYKLYGKGSSKENQNMSPKSPHSRVRKINFINYFYSSAEGTKKNGTRKKLKTGKERLNFAVASVSPKRDYTGLRPKQKNVFVASSPDPSTV